jgi:hypothetical protein
MKVLQVKEKKWPQLAITQKHINTTKKQKKILSKLETCKAIFESF